MTGTANCNCCQSPLCQRCGKCHNPICVGKEYCIAIFTEEGLTPEEVRANHIENHLKSFIECTKEDLPTKSQQEIIDKYSNKFKYMSKEEIKQQVLKDTDNRLERFIKEFKAEEIPNGTTDNIYRSAAFSTYIKDKEQVNKLKQPEEHETELPRVTTYAGIVKCPNCSEVYIVAHQTGKVMCNRCGQLYVAVQTEEAPKDKTNKPSWWLFPYEEAEEVRKVFEHGATKYHAPFTYRQGTGVPLNDLWDATKRHLLELHANGHYHYDTESQCLTWAHIAANALMAIAAINLKQGK